MKLLKSACTDVRVPKRLMIVLALMLALTSLYPTDVDYYFKNIKDHGVFVYSIENGVRYINTAAQFIIPLVLLDKVGMVQAAYVGIATMMTTHLLKYALNDVSIFGTRIGETPSRSDNNMPSGHSSMAASAMYFVCARYGWKHAFYLVPVTLLTMYARVMLQAHTLSAVLAGCMVGILVAVFFTSPYRSDK
jgi:membrane-associated phospholipid phosphatase